MPNRKIFSAKQRNCGVFIFRKTSAAKSLFSISQILSVRAFFRKNSMKTHTPKKTGFPLSERKKTGETSKYILSTLSGRKEKTKNRQNSVLQKSKKSFVRAMKFSMNIEWEEMTGSDFFRFFNSRTYRKTCQNPRRRFEKSRNSRGFGRYRVDFRYR